MCSLCSTAVLTVPYLDVLLSRAASYSKLFVCFRSNRGSDSYQNLHYMLENHCGNLRRYFDCEEGYELVRAETASAQRTCMRVLPGPSSKPLMVAPNAVEGPECKYAAVDRSRWRPLSTTRRFLGICGNLSQCFRLSSVQILTRHDPCSVFGTRHTVQSGTIPSSSRIESLLQACTGTFRFPYSSSSAILLTDCGIQTFCS